MWELTHLAEVCISSCFISSAGFKECAQSSCLRQCSARANDSQFLSHNTYRRKSASVGLSWMWARLNGSRNCLPIHLIGIHMALCMVHTLLCFHGLGALKKAAGRLSYGGGMDDETYSIYMTSWSIGIIYKIHVWHDIFEGLVVFGGCMLTCSFILSFMHFPTA